MAINSYSTLKTAVQNWMDRSDISGDVADVVMLAEAHLNREIDTVETDVTLTGSVGSRSISVSAYDFLETVGLFLVDAQDQQEYEILQQADGYSPYTTINGRPQWYAIDNSNIDFNCPLDQAYSFRWRYRGKLALSDSVTTNWLLEDHPDVYLSACIVWGGLLVQDDARLQTFSAALARGMSKIKGIIAKNKRGRTFVDESLAPRIDTSWQW